jgi:hypothetical protein
VRAPESISAVKSEIARPAIRAIICAFVLSAGVFGALPSLAETSSIAPFFGQYRGQTIKQGDGEIAKRDLDVSIEPDGDYFKIIWSTVTRYPDGEVKRKSYAISFAPTKRADIYHSAMRTDMFGNRVPLDPLSGDPFVWCRVAGRTLTVYALLIDDTGSYDLQVYDRTLTDKGLDLRFTRIREGDQPKVLSAFLQRVDARR